MKSRIFSAKRARSGTLGRITHGVFNLARQLIRIDEHSQVARFIECVGKLFDQLPVPDQSGTDLFCKHGFASQSLDIDQHIHWPVMPLSRRLPRAYTRCSSRTNKLLSSRSGTPRSFSILHPQIILLCVDRTPHGRIGSAPWSTARTKVISRKDATLVKP
jgi:hypothetical protein